MTSPHIHTVPAIEEITARNHDARRMIAGFSAQMPALAEFWQTLDTALAGNLALCAELTRLSGELAATRLDAANLLAAACATLAACHDGEPDPLYYLRDELNARHERSQGHRRGTP